MNQSHIPAQFGEIPHKRYGQPSKEKRFSETQMVNQTIESELSEWNDIFLYVIKVLKSGFPEF